MNQKFAIQHATSHGWQVVSVSAAGIQFRKVKRVNAPRALSLLVVAIVAWIAFSAPPWIILVAGALVALDYIFARERLAFLSAADIEKQNYINLK
jgi:hypothetical protein